MNITVERITAADKSSNFRSAAECGSNLLLATEYSGKDISSVSFYQSTGGNSRCVAYLMIAECFILCV